jgi:hypothetical protein
MGLELKDLPGGGVSTRQMDGAETTLLLRQKDAAKTQNMQQQTQQQTHTPAQLVPAAELFRTDEYAAWCGDHIPLRLASGENVSPTQRKKLAKKMKKHTEKLIRSASRQQ